MDDCLTKSLLKVVAMASLLAIALIITVLFETLFFPSAGIGIYNFDIIAVSQ